MELKLFIKEALKDILGAVEEAQSEIKKGEIAPLTNDSVDAAKTGLTNYQTVDFEVALSADASKGSGAKLNVVAALVGGGVEGNSSEETKHAAKLNFRIPIKYESKEV